MEITKQNLATVMKSLADYFTPTEIQWRVGSTNRDENNKSGIALAYIDSRSVMDRLDVVVGPESWQDRYDKGPDGGVLCGIGIKIDGEWVWKWDGSDNTETEAVKGGLSSAFKRCAVKWGIGRYLYEFPNVWCKLYKRGNSWMLAERPAIPQWAYPEGWTGAKESGKIVLNGAALEDKPATQSAGDTKGTQSTTGQNTQKPATQKPGNGKTEVKSATVDAEKVAKAKAYKVPANVPFAGRTLGEAMLDAQFGKHILNFLSGRATNQAGKNFQPENEEQEKVMKAAAFLLDNYDAVVSAAPSMN